ncbi:MAG: amino acid synthesis family protein [Betaproteobacteria bacterium]|nr:amino acid synthesis family protein [Betaproteobacteria bacterium]
MDIRRLIVTRDVVLAEAGTRGARPVTRAIGIAVVANPLAGPHVQDLSLLFDLGASIAELLMPQLVALLPGKATAYGKGAIVGVNGDSEHGAAICHPKMGKPMRAALGGGEAVIPSVTKVGAAGATIDLPLGHKDNPWSFDEMEVVTLSVGDAPRPGEIVVVIGISDGGRINPRVGKGRVL